MKKTTPLLLLLLLWEGILFFSPHLHFVAPPPSRILLTCFECKARLLTHTLVTLKEMAAGFALALAASFPLAALMHRYKTSRALLQPLFIAIQCVPMFALAPIMVIWFGWGFTAIVIPTALMIVFPLTLNIYQGLRATPIPLVEFFQTNSATSLQTFFKLRLPFALPHIFAGIRISAAVAGIGAVAGEWAGAQEGLGILMLESRRNADLEITFSALLCLTTLSLLLYGLVTLIEKRALPWRALTLFALLSLASCQGSQATTTRLLLDWLPNPNHVPLYVGIKKGYFAEEGITLALNKMHDSGGGISYLTSRRADLLVNHMPGVMRARAHGADVVIAGVLIQEPLAALIYKKEGTIELPENLSGRRLGYCLGCPDTTFLDYILAQGNIEPSQKHNVHVDLVSAVGAGAVDFIYGGFWNIEPFHLSSLGVDTSFFKLTELGVPSYYEMIVLANGTVSAEFLTRFRKALSKSITFCKAHPEEAFALYLSCNPDKRAKTVAWEQRAWEATCPLLADSQDVDIECVEKFASWMHREGFLTRPFDSQKLLR